MSKQSGRRGFTLVEMLMVISIIGMLMALVSVAVWNAIKSARQAKIVVEISQLAEAVNGYKEKHITYPPSLANTTTNDRKIAFMRHVSLAYTNANYGLTAASFNTTTTRVMTAQSGTQANKWGYNYVRPGDTSVTPLDLNLIDQAEALVFWLGGFPTPYDPTTNQPVAGKRLFGFHRDSDNPFKRDFIIIEARDPLRFRTDPLFDFDQTRLVDSDADGWLEYVPISPKTGSRFPPYVYFDADTYAASNTAITATSTLKHLGYPRPGDVNFSLVADWGVAGPMAMYVDPNGAAPTRWANPDSFQILSCGLDGAFAPNYLTYATTETKSLRIGVFPGGEVYTGETNFRGTSVGYGLQELDNLSNLSAKTLEGARSEAQQ